MKVEKKDLGKSQIELTVELSVQEFAPYIKRGAEKVSREVKIDGFRAGKVPYDVLKSKIGEMTILEEAARIAIDKTVGEAINKHLKSNPVGQPKIDITKLAPENPLEYKVVMAILPEVKLGEYKDLKIKRDSASVEDKEVERMINDLREMRVQEKISLREVRDGDKVIVDIQISLDNVPIEGEQNKDAGIIVGKNYIVTGFDRQLLGTHKNDIREFQLPYPKDFHQKNLAGKMVDFKITIKEVYKREIPALDEKFVSGLGLKNVEEFKKNIRKSIETQKEREAKQKTELRMLEKIIAKTRFSDIPELLVNHELEVMIDELGQSVAAQGGKFDDYLMHINKTREQLTLDMLPDAIKRVKTSLLVRELAKKENIKVEEKEVEAQIEELKKHHKDDKKTKEKVNTEEYKNYVLNVLTSRKVIDKLLEWNVEK